MMTPDSTNTERAIPARSDAGRVRLLDPDRLLSDWKVLAARHHHLHAPEAAKLMDVPEAALTAARIGTGATRLKADMAAILAPLPEWGRVLCAGSNACGVHMPLGRTDIGRHGDALLLTAAHMRAMIDHGAVQDAYLFVNSDENHGNSRSLQFFDSAGNTVLKVFIFHKTRFEEAERYLLTLKSPDQSRMISPEFPAASCFDAEAASIADDPDVAPLTGDIRAMLSAELSKAQPTEIEQVGDHTRLLWTGTPESPRFDETMFHFHQADLRAHLRYAPIISMARTASGALSLNGEEGRLLKISRKDNQ